VPSYQSKVRRFQKQLEVEERRAKSEQTEQGRFADDLVKQIRKSK